MKTAATLGLAALVLSATPVRPQERAGLTTKQLAGAYRLVSGEKNGRPIPRDHLDRSTVRFTDDTVVVTDKDRKEVFAARYKLDASRTPAVITMTSTVAPHKGVTVQGLVQREGETVRLIYALPERKGEGKGAPPAGFKTREGQLMLVLMRARE